MGNGRKGCFMEHFDPMKTIKGNELKRCESAIKMATDSYTPGKENCSTSGVLYFVYGEYLWVYVGCTPCEDTQEYLKNQYNAVFGFVTAKEPINSSTNKDFGFSYGTPLIGIPLPH